MKQAVSAMSGSRLFHFVAVFRKDFWAKGRIEPCFLTTLSQVIVEG
jgi:hypothetical protein